MKKKTLYEVYDPSGAFVKEYGTWRAAAFVASKYGTGSEVRVVHHEPNCPYLRGASPPCVHQQYPDEIWIFDGEVFVHGG